MVCRSAPKIFSKLQKHTKMLVVIETALLQIKRDVKKAAVTCDSDHISLVLPQLEFTSLTNYISLHIGLRDICFSKAPTSAYQCNTKISACIPRFILEGSETEQELDMRLASRGLTLREIKDILLALALENRVHIRRVGKTRLFTQARLKRSLSEERELNSALEQRSRVSQEKKQ